MQVPAIKGIIKRRFLVNYRVDPQVVTVYLPPPFRPKLHDGWAIAGICLIRLEEICPASMPLRYGLSSENAAHRIAVEWNNNEGTVSEGVYIPKRDTSSLMNNALGGKLFPGIHHRASFKVHWDGNNVDFKMASYDNQVKVRLTGKVSHSLPTTSVFRNIEKASIFFEAGCLGYSSRPNSSMLDGIVLKTNRWQVETVSINEVYSNYFSEICGFPENSIVFDHTLLMRDIPHEWHSHPAMDVNQQLMDCLPK